MNILITGGLGFQGLHLVQALAPDHVVTILNTPSPTATRNLLHLSEQPLAFRLVWGSVADAEIVSKVVEEQDVIFHLAAFTSVNASFQQPLAALSVNVLGTYRILDTMRRLESRAHVLVASSCEVYGDHESFAGQSEDAPLAPHSPYAAAKVGADRLAFAYAMTYGLRVTIARPCNIYGPHQRDGRYGAVIPEMVTVGLQGRPIIVTGDGSQTREFLHVDDVVRAYLLLMREQSMGVYNIGPGEMVSVQWLASRLSREFGVLIEHAPGRPGEVQAFHLDTARLHTLGFYPQVSFSDGLLAYIAWRRSQKST